MSRSEIFSLRNFQGCCLLFSYQGSLLFSCFSRVSFDIISCSFLFVKPFFNFFQQLFSFMILNGEGGIWTLAPLLTTYSLSRGAPSASLGTSPNGRNKNGEGGIRTHAPLRTNGFQDRLVMTTSIPLHILLLRCCLFCFCFCFTTQDLL